MQWLIRRNNPDPLLLRRSKWTFPLTCKLLSNCFLLHKANTAWAICVSLRVRIKIPIFFLFVSYKCTKRHRCSLVWHSHSHNILGRDGWWEHKILWHSFSSKRTKQKPTVKTLNQYWAGHEETNGQVLSLSHLHSLITASPACPLR